MFFDLKIVDFHSHRIVVFHQIFIGLLKSLVGRIECFSIRIEFLNTNIPLLYHLGLQLQRINLRFDLLNLDPQPASIIFFHLILLVVGLNFIFKILVVLQIRGKVINVSLFIEVLIFDRLVLGNLSGNLLHNKFEFFLVII